MIRSLSRRPGVARRRGIGTALPVALLLAATVTAGCGDSPTEPGIEPEPGILSLHLTSPAADDRGLLVEITGPAAITGVEPLGGYRAFAGSGGTTVRAAVFGALSTGDLLRITVPDVNRSADYSARVLEVSDAAGGLRPETAGYRISVRR